MKIQFEDKTIEINEETTIQELLQEEIKKSKHAVIGATFNNEYVNLGYKIKHDGKIKLIDIASKEGTKIYRRTLVYILGKAFEELYPNKAIIIDYQLPNSMFFEIEGIEITEEVIKNLTNHMKSTIEKDLKIEQVVMNRQEAEEFYKKNHTVRGKLQLDLKENQEIYMYYCENYYNYCYGTLANRTGITKIFEIIPYDDGLLLRYPDSHKPEELPKLLQTKKLAWALNEYDDIHKILNVNTVYKLKKIEM